MGAPHFVGNFLWDTTYGESHDLLQVMWSESLPYPSAASDPMLALRFSDPAASGTAAANARAEGSLPVSPDRVLALQLTAMPCESV